MLLLIFFPLLLCFLRLDMAVCERVIHGRVCVFRIFTLFVFSSVLIRWRHSILSACAYCFNISIQTSSLFFSNNLRDKYSLAIHRVVRLHSVKWMSCKCIVYAHAEWALGEKTFWYCWSRRSNDAAFFSPIIISIWLFEEEEEEK